MRHFATKIFLFTRQAEFPLVILETVLAGDIIFIQLKKKIVHSVNLQIHHSHVQTCGNMARPGVINFPSGQGGSAFFLSRVLLVLAKMQFRSINIYLIKQNLQWTEYNLIQTNKM